MGELEGRTVVVAGVGRGLGRRVALTAAREGAALVLGARTAATLQEVAAEAGAAGAEVATQPADVATDEGCAALVDAAVQRFGGLDGLAVLVALDTVLGGVERTPLRDWQAAWEMNLLAPVRLLKAALPALKAAGGSVVLIGSQMSLFPSPHVRQVAYASAKGALLSAGYQLAADLGRYRIRVNVVAPGWMWGEPVEALVGYQAERRGVGRDEVLAGITDRMPLPEMATEQDVAEAVVFLLSNRAKAVTGQCLLVNAGELMR